MVRGRLASEAHQCAIIRVAEELALCSADTRHIMGSRSLPDAVRNNYGVIYRTLLYHESYGQVRTRKRKRRRWSATPTAVLEIITEIVTETPALFVDEIVDLLVTHTGMMVSTTVVETHLLNMQICVKRSEFRNLNRVPSDRITFRQVLDGEVDVRSLIFLDETHVARRDIRRMFARSVRGTAPVVSNSYIPELASVGATLITACCIDGVILDASYYFTQSNDRSNFEIYLEDFLIPNLQPYPLPNSVLIIDNATIHHNGRIDAMVTAIGAVLVYLPTYSYDYNPIELVFAKLKKYLKRYSHLASGPTVCLKNIIFAGLRTINATDMRAFFRHCYIDVSSLDGDDSDDDDLIAFLLLGE